MSAPARKNSAFTMFLFTLSLATLIFGLLAVLWGQDWRWAPTALGASLVMIIIAGLANSNRS